MTKIDPNKLRKDILDMVYNKQSGHIGGSFSLCEIISYLYSEYDLINKDKLILSKGHGVPVLYAILYELGYLKELDSFREINSQLQGHPVKEKLEYMHATTGSLGQGLSIAIGHALASKMKELNNRIFCIVGDGEIQEGQPWEAFMFAYKHKLNNLVCLIDYNKAQNDDYIENTMPFINLQKKIESFGWKVISIDGHNMDEIEKSLKIDNENFPLCIILDTVKGKGVSFMENAEWHAKVPTEEEYIKAKKELGYE